MGKIVKRLDKRDKDPTDGASDRQILRDAGYSDLTKTSEIMSSQGFQRAAERYYKTNAGYIEVQEGLAAKARRNLDEGMDDRDKTIKIKYTALQLKQEADMASRSKLEIKDIDGNMMTLLGIVQDSPDMMIDNFKPKIND